MIPNLRPTTRQPLVQVVAAVAIGIGLWFIGRDLASGGTLQELLWLHLTLILAIVLVLLLFAVELVPSR